VSRAPISFHDLHPSAEDPAADGLADLAKWRHQALSNEAQGRIEMPLVSLMAQQGSLLEQAFHIAAGESIHTEDSYKYSEAEFRDLASKAGLTTDVVWVDAGRLLSLHLLQTGNADEG
jgi:uncharacterized SAM-dependent methyltransferase